MHIVPIILSGGAGTRLWPMSRETLPKPFLALPGGGTLLEGAVRRALELPGDAPLLTIANREHYFATRDAYAGIDFGAREAAYMLEPSARNTAGAVALGVQWAIERRGPDAVMLVIPADHLVRDAAAFAEGAARAAAIAHDGALVTFGVPPTRPETGFGYIECGAALDAQEPQAFAVARFVEKPPLADAQRYLAGGRHLWNTGFFCMRADAAIAAFEASAPDVLEAARDAWNAHREPGDGTIEFDAAAFERIPAISFDYAVMEKARNAVVVRAPFDWSDIGSWQALAELMPADADGNRALGEHVAVHSRDTYVHATGRLVATVGVDNLVVVETPDAVLVADRDSVQRVREVVGALKQRGSAIWQSHQTVQRPWGRFTVLHEAPGFKVKRIDVKAGAALSLQRHRQRREHWVVVAGVAEVTVGERQFSLGPGESTDIATMAIHRIVNRGDMPLSLIEVQLGDYLGEDDIERFDDRYGRA